AEFALWVVGFNKEKNQLIVTNKENDPDLFSRTVILTDLNFISGQPSQKSIKIKAKIRFNQPLAWAKLYPDRAKLVFDKPQKAITPGQWAVFYQGQVCLGGGIIV
ncbi:unnamed protein product, partial [marine sediment metagenome]